MLLLAGLLGIALLLLPSALPPHAVFAHLLVRVEGARPTSWPLTWHILHHHDYLIIAVVLSFAGADLHELWHEGRGRHQLVFEVVLAGVLLVVGLRLGVVRFGTDVAYSISLTHKLVSFWHFHQALAVQLTW